jgi:hypothetical protein
MSYKFTGCELIDIKQIVDANGEWGIRSAFYWWNEFAKDTIVKVEDVEDFAIAFMSQYNEEFGVTY